ncbi:MAG: MmgE/PrpD family protein [Pseudomonadota bacterium]
MASLTRALARILLRPVEEPTRERAKLHLLDFFGCAFAGAAEPAGRILLGDATTRSTGRASLIGGGTGEESVAAFANGGLGNVLEMDDVHRTAILHPGPVTIPAALAAAQTAGADGRTLLAAIAVGYEAVIRVGRSLGPAHYGMWHNTASVGPFGAAAAVGHILGLDEDQLVSALGNAGTQVSGPWQCRHEPVMTKQLHTARAAHAGLMAARLAAQGFSGPEFILEGPQGLYAATAPDADPQEVTAEASVPMIFETSFKPWPACRHVHAAIDAALLARERIGEAANIHRVAVATYGDALAFCDRPVPTSTIEAKFSLQHAVAATLTDGPPGFHVFDPSAVRRTDLSDLRGRTTVSAGPPYADAYPARYGARVVVEMSDGATIEADVPDALGDPENPLSKAGVVEKAQTLFAHAGVGEAAAAALVETTLDLEGRGSLTLLGEQIAAAATG